MTSMEQINLISQRAREAGMTYGAYISKYGNQLGSPVYPSKLEKHERICKKCGAVFQLRKGPGGQYNERKTCFQCEENQKNKSVPAKKTHVKRFFVVRCSECGRTMTTGRAPWDGCKNYCTRCKPIVEERRHEEKRAKRRKRYREVKK